MKQPDLLGAGPEMSGFEAFWSAYPRKVGKGAARRAYALATKKVSAGELLTKLRAYPFDLSRPQWIPHPSTWLNGERWADELGPSGPIVQRGGWAQSFADIEAEMQQAGYRP